jgi:hypothetical protein
MWLPAGDHGRAPSHAYRLDMVLVSGPQSDEHFG